MLFALIFAISKDSDAHNEVSANPTIIEKQYLEEIYFYLTFPIRSHK